MPASCGHVRIDSLRIVYNCLLALHLHWLSDPIRGSASVAQPAFVSFWIEP
jgi:hypothetical protein